MSNRPTSQLEKVFEAAKRETKTLNTLIKQKDWFNLFLYLIAFICVFFTPEIGILSTPLEKAVESSEHVSMNYSSIFALSIFIIGFILFIFKAVEFIKDSEKVFKVLLTVVISSLFIVSLNSLSSQISFASDKLDNQISWGEEALVLKNRPEAVIYKYNTLALEAAKSLFNQPLEIATSLPISRRDGIDDAEEVLRGIAVAQHDWNESHPNTQFVIAIADDGYQDSKNEIPSARRAAEEILEYQKILGVIGHFTSAATQATAQDYNDKDVVLVSPTSTAVRCGQEVNIEKDSCLSIGSNSNVFRTAINDRLASHRLVDYIGGNRPNISKVAVLYESDDPYSRSFKEMFMDGAEELSTGPRKLEVINTRGVEKYSDCNFSDYNPNNPESSRKQVKGCFDTYAKGADTLLLVPSIKDDQWVEEVLMVNYEEDYGFNLLGSDSMYQESFINQKGVEREEAAGLLIPVTWHRSAKTCSSSSTSLECNENEFQNWEGINWRTATGYDAAQALFNAIDLANKHCTLGRYVGARADCIKSQLVDTLENIELEEGTSGDPIKFTGGDRDAKGVVVEAVGGFFKTVSQ